MEGYLLYRKEGKTAVVIIAEDDDELSYLLRKLHRSRVKWLKDFAGKLLEDFFTKSHSEEPEPPVTVVTNEQAN